MQQSATLFIQIGIHFLQLSPKIENDLVNFSIADIAFLGLIVLIFIRRLR
jgi:hypothetical protein